MPLYLIPCVVYGCDYRMGIAAVMSYTIICRARQQGAHACGQPGRHLALPSLPENNSPPPCLRGPRLTPIILSYNCVGQRRPAGEQTAASHPLRRPPFLPTPCWTVLDARSPALDPRREGRGWETENVLLFLLFLDFFSFFSGEGGTVITIIRSFFIYTGCLRSVAV